MKIKRLVLLMLSATVGLVMKANNPTDSEHPKGKAIINVFTNFHTGFGTKNDYRGFELDRSYLGYEYRLGHGLKVKGVMDIGKSSDVTDYQRIAYIKNAVLTWKYEGLSISGGLIPTTQFNMQEKCWGNRYIMKSFQDQYGFGTSADLGISVAYQWKHWLALDAILVNGEGYKKVQVKDGLLYGLGVTLKPLKGIIVRVYGSLNESAEDEEKDSYNLATFIGYKNKRFSVGGEFNKVVHADFLPNKDMEGISFYGNVSLTRAIDVYARYDQLFVKGETAREQEEYVLMGGLAFKLGKYVRLAPNFRFVHPTSQHEKKYGMAFINCYFGL